MLESRIVSDLQDSRFRARLIKSYVVGGDVIFPEGTVLIGDVAATSDRWQNRVSLQVTNANYPDGEREISFNGLVMDFDESTHLPADDVDYRTGKAAAAVAGLAALGAVSGYAGRHQDSVAALAGAETARGLSDLAERPLDRILDRPPTLTVDPMHLVWVFVDASFDAPVYEELPPYSAATGAGTAAPKPETVPGESELGALVAQLATLRQQMADVPGPRGHDASR